MSRLVVFDTETTGLNPNSGDRLIEIGCLEIVDRRPGRTFHAYVNPERDVPEDSVAIHGLTEDFLEDMPLFRDVCDELADFLRDADAVAHNAPFDVSFLDNEFRYAGRQETVETLTRSVVDTLAIARRRWPGKKNSLDALCERLGISTAQREREGHGALLDAELLARVYLEMTAEQHALFEPESTGDDETAATEGRDGPEDGPWPGDRVSRLLAQLPTDSTARLLMEDLAVAYETEYRNTPPDSPAGTRLRREMVHELLGKILSRLPKKQRERAARDAGYDPDETFPVVEPAAGDTPRRGGAAPQADAADEEAHRAMLSRIKEAHGAPGLWEDPEQKELEKVRERERAETEAEQAGADAPGDGETDENGVPILHFAGMRA